ncbi:MAG: RagB/SusD family nutrient uptake outer membrane protein [Bacteroidales bacterium]
MKKVRFYILMILAVFMASCDKYLEVDSLSVNDLDYIFTNPEQARNFVNSIYQPFTAEANRFVFYFNMNTDIEFGQVSGAYDNGRRDLWAYDIKETNQYMEGPWKAAYLAIDRANAAIDGILGSQLYSDKDPDMLQLLGEAYTLRAYWYLEVVRNWGDVPYSRTRTKAGDNFYLPKTDRDTILSDLINDLILIEPDMKWANELQFGVEYASREFAQAMIARLSLMRGGYSLRPIGYNGQAELKMVRNDDFLDYYRIANTYCDKLIQSGTHKLNLDFKTVFLNQCKHTVVNNDDMIFEIAYSSKEGQVGYLVGVTVNSGTTTKAHEYGKGGGVISLTPSYVYSFDTLDARLPVTCYFHYWNDNFYEVPTNIIGNTGIQIGKWSKVFSNYTFGYDATQGDGINWPVMRYADVLLMYAETENELNNGPTASAKDALRTVRRRAYAQEYWDTKVDDYVDSISASKETFFEALVNERAWEFGGEMIRKADLMRWNKLGEKIAYTRTTLIQMGIDANAGSGTYVNLPDRIYYKIDSTTKTIDIVGKYSRLTNTPAGYTLKDWLKALVVAGVPDSRITTNWRGYTDDAGIEPVRYIYPLPQAVIINSNGALKNGGYDFAGF